MLFKNKPRDSRKPNNLLCHGIEQSESGYHQFGCKQELSLPGLVQRRANQSIEVLKQATWSEVLNLIGGDGELILSNIFMNYSVFVAGQNDSSYIQQLTGSPFHDICLNISKTNTTHKINKSPQSICFVRSRILYASAPSNRDGRVQPGLKHMHILNRMQDTTSHVEDCIILRYFFPKQFKMHNAFTSQIDRRQTVQPYKDYTFREDELNRLSKKKIVRVPKRLRGSILKLIRGVRTAHKRCPYSQLLLYYCPMPSSSRSSIRTAPALSTIPPPTASSTDFKTQLSVELSAVDAPEHESQHEDIETSFIPYTTPTNRVVNFITAAVKNILPKKAFGTGKKGHDNWHHILRWIQRFIHMRRFESMSLHEVVQGISLKSINWLASDPQFTAQNMSLSEKDKRTELLHEFIYYIFDSLMIPLIASNFYVTESGLHRNRLIYFRHDVWQRLCLPTLTAFKVGSLIPVRGVSSRSSQSSVFGHNLCRFLPKETGTRMITNLKRRAMQKIGDKYILQMSTNARLGPIFSILNYEKCRQPDSSLQGGSSPNIRHKLEAFHDQLAPTTSSQEYYFVKVDIQSAFDSIPQGSLLELVDSIFQQSEYRTLKKAITRCLGGTDVEANARVKFVSDIEGHEIKSSSRSNLNTVVENFMDSSYTTTSTQAQALLRDHIQNNTLKVGNKLYRQSIGIPQGSVLSSMLCTFFYNDFERKRLHFLDPSTSLLLRVIDDFLLITTSRSQARRFVNSMTRGDESFGIVVHPQKSLVNFDMDIKGTQIPKLTAQTSFPFCGFLINTKNLSISKDRVRKDNAISNTLTVDLHGHVGEKLIRRLASSLQIQLQQILLSPKLNDRIRVVQTLIECFQETSMKLHRYMLSMPHAKRPSQDLIIRLLEKLMNHVARMFGSSQKTYSHFTQPQIRCIASMGVHRVLSLRRTGYNHVLHWLEELKEATMFSVNLNPGVLDNLCEAAFQAICHYRF